MPPQAQNTEKTIESFATGTQYKMTMRVFKPSGAYTTTTKYNCSRISMDKYEFTETGLYRIVTYAKPTSENAEHLAMPPRRVGLGSRAGHVLRNRADRQRRRPRRRHIRP